MIDFHCHLDLYPSPHEIARDCKDRDMSVLSVTTTPSAWAGTTALTRGISQIRTALGLHPQIAHERKSELSLFEDLLPSARYVGEVGLDGSPELKPHWAAQAEVFDGILDACGRAGGRVLSIHSRRAATPVLDALRAHPDAGVPILHWFSGSRNELARAVEMGCWFSVGPSMLLGDRGRALVAEMPRDRVLTESDGPFAQLERRPVLPWDVSRATAAVARLWGEPASEVQEQLANNLRWLW